ncbi:uncharacterized protein LOC121639796 isoform X3 [Melanotaenia boesemani]|uniref:uncharacterized protein LOC121639796 isoform X3 n=1 Tax=Melanotaenia boesemani TaxID=1250792 RepID=UPI001C05628D|nr:uncharacterized protein LOC121639796 isoform X3 [Melanotaenia boesemani]XP_041841242.1 uncharacterized protein LOC121639796 isoform X3 [Melanotaenia boesemani]
MLLLFVLCSSVCATFVVNVTQSSYQAEENHNITLEWTFTTKPDVSWRFLFIICNLITDHRVLTLYRVHDGVEVPESQDEKFAGRVQSDKDVLREGRIRLRVSRPRTNDSGLYMCDVKTDYGFSSEKYHLNVTGLLNKRCHQRELSAARGCFMCQTRHEKTLVQEIHTVDQVVAERKQQRGALITLRHEKKLEPQEFVFNISMKHFYSERREELVKFLD